MLSRRSPCEEKAAGPRGLCWETAGKGRQRAAGKGEDLLNSNEVQSCALWTTKSALSGDLGAGGGS